MTLSPPHVRSRLCAEPPRMFERVLVANRGEIALRVMRSLRSLGVSPVAVHSDADAAAPHVRFADMAVRVGPAPARQSYLDIEAVIAAAVSSGAEAVHPGYGFLSENPTFAEACAAAGLVFIGPPVTAMAAMADKIAAKVSVAAAGVSVVPGTDRAGLDDEQLIAYVEEHIGYPALVKPSAGGGGKGMRLVLDAAELPAALASARREAAAAFGDDTLLVERFISAPRHVEIQVLADGHGGIVHLGERECSLQRRHQKIIEEAPASFLPDHVRAAMAEQAVAAARSCGYVNAGTVEFIVSGDDPESFYFMEMNTRLQVEHPVTEMVFGVDLVAEQVRVAAGAPLVVDQESLVPLGHAVEARVYAEDPARSFLPTGGTIRTVDWPSGPGVRVDAGVADGSIVTSDYDPMLAKVVVHGADRAEALARLADALGRTSVVGIGTNTGFLRELVRHPDVRGGRVDTDLVNREIGSLVRSVPAAVLAAVADAARPSPTDGVWTALVGWRHGGAAPVRRRLVADSTTHRIEWEPGVDGKGLLLLDGTSMTITCRDLGEWTVVPLGPGRWWVAGGGWGWEVAEAEAERGRGGAVSGGVADGCVRSPMPGTVLMMDVTAGDRVTAGQRLCVVEAMKMEHALVAPFDGVVERVGAVVGASVALGAELVMVGGAPAGSE
jgi:acetyl-CoA/propionyl-CoA carboxylase biotin carboxyl carrier protein